MLRTARRERGSSTLRGSNMRAGCMVPSPAASTTRSVHAPFATSRGTSFTTTPACSTDAHMVRGSTVRLAAGSCSRANSPTNASTSRDATKLYLSRRMRGAHRRLSPERGAHPLRPLPTSEAAGATTDTRPGAGPSLQLGGVEGPSGRGGAVSGSVPLVRYAGQPRQADSRSRQERAGVPGAGSRPRQRGRRLPLLPEPQTCPTRRLGLASVRTPASNVAR
jgi:hypothetical protein